MSDSISTRAKTWLLAGAALAIAATPARAQDSGAQPSGAISGRDEIAPGTAGAEDGDIIVTARKRAEDIQSVPIAITAYTAQDLQERNITNLADLSNSTPGIAITSIAGGTLLSIYVRGLAPANTANDLNVDANVGVFVDGIYQTSRNTLDVIAVLDVGQIEVAKGPQSALYGRSTFAGALGISTKRPTRSFDGSITGTIGENKDYRLRGTVGGPVSDVLFARVAAGYLTYDGYGRNLASKDNLGGVEKFAATASLEFAPGDGFTARLSGLYTYSRAELTPSYVLPIGAFNCGVAPAAASPVAGLQPPLFCGTLRARKTSDVSPRAPETIAKNAQVSLDLNWDFGPASLVSVTGLTQGRNHTYNDYDGTSAGTLAGICGNGAACLGVPAYNRLTRINGFSISIERVNTFSQELRLQSADDSAFKWLVGGYYFNSRVPLSAGGIGVGSSSPLGPNDRIVQVNQLGQAGPTGTGAYEFTANPFLVGDFDAQQLSASYSAASTKSKSLFGAIGYTFGTLSVNAEGRYNIDNKRAQVFSLPANPTAAPGINRPIYGFGVPAPGTFPVAGVLYRRKFKSFAPRFTVDWQATPQIFVYASAAKGIRSGGFNTINPADGSATGILPSEAAYDEETNWTYEGGVKTRLFDRALLFNASVFYVDWKNAQVSTFTQNPNATTVNRIVLNAGGIRARGFELQSDLNLGEMFGVGGSFTYSDPQFRAGAYDGGTIAQCVNPVPAGTPISASTAANGCPPVIIITRANGTSAAVPSLKGLRPQRAVKTQWNLHATVNAPLGDTWRLAGRVDVNYSGPQYSNIINTVSFGKRTLVNARISFDSDRYSIALFGNNIFDKVYVQNSINQPRLGAPFTYNFPEIYLGEGRRLGVTGSVKF